MGRNTLFFLAVMACISLFVLAATAAEQGDTTAQAIEPFVINMQSLSTIGLMGIVVKWFMGHIDAKDEKFVKAIRDKDVAYEQLALGCRHETAELTAIVLRHVAQRPQDLQEKSARSPHDGG